MARRRLRLVAAFLVAVGVRPRRPAISGCPPFGDDAPIWPPLMLFVVAILAGVPVGFVLLLATPPISGAATPPR